MESRKHRAANSSPRSFWRCVALTSDDKSIISGSVDKTIRIWSISKKQQVAVLNGHTDIVNSIAITHNDKYLVSGSADSTVRVWNLQNRVQETILKDQNSIIAKVAVICDDKCAFSFDTNGVVGIWDLQTRQGKLMIRDVREILEHASRWEELKDFLIVSLAFKIKIFQKSLRNK